ncbi:hypothetical protein JDV02_001902 [Purpureocillium takamizusanense]|uniref:Protein kinase domain-containing protein n=1 Tax=Purpureocillium takamizusanense TaxID=2060973 RepID=A0A9Q8V6X7_9HYPO|nr:uncharacterized protein JDV02_001902 [Purpureocillium takamizusanense]UNI15365.1 hypothetical protein JDV02_001902 [Purpureocillium takamizusanense]
MASEQYLKFEWNSQTLHGWGGPIHLPNHTYSNIIRLSLAGETIHGLPDQIILKKQGDRPELFQTEQTFYKNEKGLQDGGFVPQYHGLARIDGEEALVLSDLGGTMMHDNPSLAKDENALREKLTELLTAIRQAGVVHEDITVLNVLHCADSRFRLVDFEEATIYQPVDEAEIKDGVAVQVEELVGIMKGRHKAEMSTRRWESGYAIPMQHEALRRPNLSAALNAVNFRSTAC